MISAENINGTAISLTVIASLLTAGRFAIHWRKNRKLRWDDWLNALALIFLIAMVAIFEIYVPIEYNAFLYSTGHSSRPPTHVEVLRDMKLNIATLILFFLILYAVKASFLALYWEIFQVSTRFRTAWFVLTGYVGVSFVVTLITIFTRCGAAKDFANLEVCSLRSRALFVGYQSLWCILNVLGDILLMILPTTMLKSLHMGVKHKVGLAAVFALVLVIVAMDILRTVYTLDMDLADGQDANALWGILEPTIAVIVCALPCYRGLLGFRPDSSQNESFWSSDRTRSSAWSRLFKSSSSRSESERSDSQGRVGTGDSDEKDSFSKHSHV
ncbi:hypothetical protein K491DRAFT_637099 [Lophiostoma macrostomum CBS 122681]|uniref:Rhodopsin domain-containing protein n=1 Tax=Lophiostoma macrostomum CBS 122681 TaxID=1314788 RepID=A0A6A6SXB3_9PLEO|nr:hypothetical protein K491DRAFT_637099 [Lophiostoma macrostomum CBS 122681]